MTSLRGLSPLKTLAVAGFALVMAGSVPASAHVTKMDAEVHTVVIERLEKSLLQTRENETVSHAPIRTRLADLYADRARLRSMEEAEKSCSDCTGALGDRKRALELYELVVRDSDKETRGPLLLQMAHLYKLTNQSKRAEEKYETVVREGRKVHSQAVMAEGLIGRAEARFAKADFRGAQSDFEEAMRLSEPERKGHLLHRIAWCNLNKGEQSKAVRGLIAILNEPALMSRKSSEGTTFDSAFQEDVARDLATFMARGPVSQRDIETLESLTPQAVRRDNLRYFAAECERLGQKPAAIDAWAVAAKYEKDPTDRLEMMVRVAQIRFDLGQKPQAIQGLRDAVAFWQKNGCRSNEKVQCDQLQGRLRQLVITWNRQEKKEPTVELLEAYKVYLAKFDDDAEMNQWAAEVARSLKRYPEAVAYYRKASVLAAAGGKDKQALLESAVVGQIEIAELGKKREEREAAYDHYLKMNPNGAIAPKVRYQRAHIAYESGNSREAANRFHAFASSSDCRPRAASSELTDLCTKAADLDLDSLVLLQDHSTVESRALEYAEKGSASRRMEYLKIARTAVLKQTEKQDSKPALKKLATADLRGASQEERIRFHKTRLALAEKAQDLQETRSAASDLLKAKGVSAQDQELAMGKLAWVAEMTLNFGEAYNLTRKMKTSSLRPDERALKLAMLAELSGRNPRAHEEEFLSLTRDRRRAALIRAKMVRTARSPMNEFSRQEPHLRNHPEILAPLALEIYAKTQSVSFARSALASRSVARQPAGRALERQLFLREFAQVEARLARHELRSTSDAAIQRTLAERLKLIAATEQSGNQAIRSQDFSSQLVTLAVLSRENKRLYDDILALPIPRKLKVSQREQYQRMVAAQAQVYKDKHRAIEGKLQPFWSNRGEIDAMLAEHAAARPEMRNLLARELRMIAGVAPGSIRRGIESGLQSGSKLPSETELASARREAQEKPFNARSLERLKNLENGRGRETMVAYLDARLTKLKEGEL
jgi:tetratricopeptide (TPR) repeat protein